MTHFVQPEKIEIDANERAVNEKSPYCFFVCTTFDSFLNDLKKWIDTYLYSLFPLELRKRIVELTIPSVGQVVGWDKEHFEADDDEQLPLMKLRKNRVAYFNNECEWGWLRNATKKEYSSAAFAYVNGYGNADSGYASGSGGVRPAFRLKK